MAASLPELDAFDRNGLTDARGTTFKDFRRLLTPRWGRVWADIAAGYVALGVIFAGLIIVDHRAPRALPIAVVLGTLACGYAIAYIQLFFHEAAHYNLAADRKLNDRLANLFIGLMTGQNIKAYRIVHFDHHRHLGTPQDTERSYFNAANTRFVLESLTGIKLVRVFLARRKHLDAKAAAKQVTAQPNGRSLLLMGMLLNLAILGFAIWYRSWSLFLAWPLGMVVVHPAVNAIRQLLEHRSFDAKSSIDYATEPHGALTRTFGTGPLANTLGAAGFNRHLLHHWEPQISYTRFAELEAFLLESAARDTLAGSKTTYVRTFIRLMSSP